MDAEDTPKPRRKAARKQPRDRTSKRRKNLCLSAESLERVRIHGARERMTDSAVVEWLIDTYLRRYVVHDHGAADAA